MATRPPDSYDRSSIRELKKEHNFDQLLSEMITERLRQRTPLECQKVLREVVAKINPGMHDVFD
jgi:hypothetical protein